MPDPLHPAVVHFPIVLAFLLPGFALWALVRDGRRPGGRRVWPVVIVLCAVFVASTWLATETGEDQEDRVEHVVPHDAFEAHEEAAERVLIGAVLCFLAGLAGLAAGRLGQMARVATVGLSIVVLLAAARTGQLGGELVYRHGAASAYTPAAVSVPNGVQPGRTGHEDHDDD